MTPETYRLVTQACNLLVEASVAVRNETTGLVANNDHIELIRHFANVRVVTERIKEARESIDEMEKQLSREYIPDAMKAHDVKTITLDKIGRVSIGHRWSCSILHKELGMAWLRDTGNSSLIIETVNASTLAAFAKDLTETKGKDLPQDIFKTSIMPYTSITKV